MSDPGSLGPLLGCVNTWYDITEHDKCCLHLIFWLCVRLFIIWQCPDSYETVKHAFLKIYLNIKMSAFETKKENILAGFTIKHDMIYVSWIRQHQI